MHEVWKKKMSEQKKNQFKDKCVAMLKFDNIHCALKKKKKKSKQCEHFFSILCYPLIL